MRRPQIVDAMTRSVVADLGRGRGRESGGSGTRHESERDQLSRLDPLDVSRRSSTGAPRSTHLRSAHLRMKRSCSFLLRVSASPWLPSALNPSRGGRRVRLSSRIPAPPSRGCRRSGLPSTATRSARRPGAIVPRSVSPHTRAPSTVAARSARDRRCAEIHQPRNVEREAAVHAVGADGDRQPGVEDAAPGRADTRRGSRAACRRSPAASRRRLRCRTDDRGSKRCRRWSRRARRASSISASSNSTPCSIVSTPFSIASRAPTPPCACEASFSP